MRAVRLWGWFALAVLAAQSGHAQTPNLLQRGVEERLHGNFSAAIQDLKLYLKSAPRDADAWLNLGLAYTNAHHYRAAEAALRQGLAIAPNYADLRLAYARLAYFQEHNAQARERLAPLLVGPASQEAQKLLGAINRAEQARNAPAWRVDVVGSYSMLSKHLPAWREEDLSIAHNLDARTILSLGLEQTRRFNIDNTYLHMAISHNFGPVAALLGYGGSPNAVYRARHDIVASLSAPLGSIGRGFEAVAGLDGSFAWYPTGAVDTVQPVLMLEHGDALSLSARYIHTRAAGRTLSGFALRGTVRLMRGLLLNAGYANAPDTSAGITYKVEAVSAGLTVDLNATNALQLSAARETGAPYTRTDIIFGITHRF
ncbi:MAG: YaiO family outer membrane beta-barrel protein [Alphaproteobacteria bacterium]|nr:YaiO family outer membrane beta-barrel protein [Alphaproteobacteria bacterium]